jgi:hypothetical protein
MSSDPYDSVPAIERRSHPRTPRRLVVDILNMGDDPTVPHHQELLRGETLEVSIGGLRIALPYSIREGLEIAVVLRANAQFQAFIARIVWTMREKDATIYGLAAPRIHPDRLP